MCRHLGYLGPPVPVGEMLTRGTHSLRTQSWAPREMRGGGTINADGFGVAWWVPEFVLPDEGTGVGDGRVAGRIGGRAPITLRASRYRNPAPIWTDPAVDEVLPQLRSRAVLAAVRSATVGMPVERTACAPYTHGRWAFSHNGVVPEWRRVLAEVAAESGAPALLDAESHTDSAVLWVILRELLEAPDASRNGSADGYAVADTAESWTRVESAREDRERPARILSRLASAVLARAPRARLNLLLGDGETLWATTAYHSLSVLVTDEAAVVASEPYDDDPRWQPVADRQLVTAQPGHLSVVPLESVESERARS
ncbi:glutamine amidotransferase [Nocardia transvalensis]|uniref:Gamma-glutamyl-hercynylcysteine sulfoxide hydrolase n=1 Tax=Nocardia transvalensis TaxID=37333 RepID=A0A7W9PB47_9NOCA|nr:class II glutamine amidotransferase [Nocardia transvalensis]MBB5912715.1 glutamine amidotransferase [Nocardia transvalensis]